MPTPTPTSTLTPTPSPTPAPASALLHLLVTVYGRLLSIVDQSYQDQGQVTSLQFSLYHQIFKDFRCCHVDRSLGHRISLLFLYKKD